MNKALHIIFLVSLTLAIVLGSLYYYVYENLNQNRSELVDLYKKTAESKIVLNNLQSIEHNIKKTLADGNKVSALFLKSETIVDFIQAIEGLIKDSGVSGSVDSVADSSNKTENGVKERLGMVIGAKGNWSGVVSVVGLLERLPYKSTLNAFTLINSKVDQNPLAKKTASTTKEWQLKANLDVWTIKTDQTKQAQEPAETN